MPDDPQIISLELSLCVPNSWGTKGGGPSTSLLCPAPRKGGSRAGCAPPALQSCHGAAKRRKMTVNPKSGLVPAVPTHSQPSRAPTPLEGKVQVLPDTTTCPATRPPGLRSSLCPSCTGLLPAPPPGRARPCPRALAQAAPPTWSAFQPSLIGHLLREAFLDPLSYLKTYTLPSTLARSPSSFPLIFLIILLTLQKVIFSLLHHLSPTVPHQVTEGRIFI